MNSNVQIILLSLVGVVVLITFIVALRVKHKQQQRYYRGPDLGDIEDFNTQEDEIIRITKPNKVAQQATPKNDLKLRELGFDTLDAMFSDTQLCDASEQTEFSQEEISEIQQEFSNIIVLHIMSKPGQKFIGYELLQSLLAAGLRYGEMSIFHRYQQANGQGLKLFSLASATEPGIFDMNKMGAFSCQGLSLFMQLDGTEHNLKALEIMLNTAQQLADDLDGHVLDSKRKPLSSEVVAKYRELVKQHQARLAL